MWATTIGLEEQAWTPSRRTVQSDLIGACRAVIAKESSATPNGGSARVLPDSALYSASHCRSAYIEASLRSRTGWTPLLEAHRSLVKVLVEEASSGATGTSCSSWRAIGMHVRKPPSRSRSLISWGTSCRMLTNKAQWWYAPRWNYPPRRATSRATPDSSSVTRARYALPARSLPGCSPQPTATPRHPSPLTTPRTPVRTPRAGSPLVVTTA